MTTHPLAYALAGACAALTAVACDLVVDTTEVAAPPDGDTGPGIGAGVVFSDTVRPVFEDYCNACHNAGTKSGGVDLSSHAALLESGVVVPGEPDKSRIIVVLEAGAMPPPGRPPLPPEAISWIREWIDDGALNN